MSDWLKRFGERGLQQAENIGQAILLLKTILRGVLTVICRPHLLMEQLNAIGVQTVSIIIVAGLFVGMVLALQGYAILARFGAEAALGLMVSTALVRELGPVLAALLFAGRAGSALTAEIGLMKATEQLSSLEMMAINPKYRILSPRFLAGIISVPLLAALFSGVGILGAWMLADGMLVVEQGAFWGGMQAGVDFPHDVLAGIIKSIVFGFFISWIAVYHGYNAKPTSEGVGSATTRTVVQASLMVLGLDFVLTVWMFGGL